MMLLTVVTVKGQIVIGGNVYGGGNQGEVKGNTTVTVKAGNIGARGTDSETPLADPRGKVFGGARMADVGGNTFVHIDGKDATGDMVINQVYGGNDIAGNIGKSEDATIKRDVPTELTQAARDKIDNSWNSMVLVSSKNTSETTYSATSGDVVTTHATASTESVKKIFIGQLFGGGNGDFDYRSRNSTVEDTPVTIHEVFNWDDPNHPVATKTTARGGAGFTHPDLARSYVDVHGGTIVHAYGGGNNVTITEKNVIRVENPSAVVTSIVGDDVVGDALTTTELLTTSRFHEMGVASKSGYSQYKADEYQIAYFFGGNNKDTMAIRPTWHLIDGKIRTLYSGGNRGPMIYENGLFLEVPETSRLAVGDLYGGCRMADVRPMKWNPDLEVEGQEGLGGYVDVDEVNNDIPNYTIPRNLAARVVVSGGKVHNVYGGNDITGRVYFGNAIGIRSSISGNVYGGGNGNYAYTDNPDLMNDENYGDFYYDKLGKSAVEALLDFRPNAEQVSIHIRGKDKDHPTIIGGSVFVGGNCATLKADDAHKNLNEGNYPLTELKIGSWVIADNVYLGNNGEGLVTINEQKTDPDTGDVTQAEGVLRTYQRIPEGSQNRFNSMDLTQASQMSTYMQGVAMSQVPRLSVDVAGVDREGYVPYTSFIGSLFFGGNRGSMTYSGPLDITPAAPVYIYNKLVGGCNNANIPTSDFNVRYEGGILGSAEESDAEGEPNYYTDNTKTTIRNRVVMNLSKIKVVPMRLKPIDWDHTDNWDNVGWTNLEWSTYDKDGNPESLAATPVSFESETSPATLPIVTGLSTGTITATDNVADFKRRLVGGNIYGGCHESGHVNGSVVINLKGTLHPRHDIFDAFSDEEVGDDILYDRESYNITARHSGVILNEQGVDVLGDALSVYGGGRGKETQVWGSASVNVERGYTFQIYGGSEEGAIGKGTWQDGEKDGSTGFYKGAYTYPTVADAKYSTAVTLNCGIEGKSRADNSTESMADVEYIYGGGFNGPIIGNTRVNLDNGRVFSTFGGSCNADILGYAETYVGLNGFPYLRDNIYGGNDLGGQIKGVGNFDGRVSSAEVLAMVHAKDRYNLADNTETPDGIKDVLQANAYVEYRNGRVKDIFGGCSGNYDYETEYTEDKNIFRPKLNNAFVNFRPDDYSGNSADQIYGAGEGASGDRVGDKVQNRSYVLIDIANDKDNFKNTEVFGSGMNNGLGVAFTPEIILAEGTNFNYDKASAIIDLARGQFGAAYGGAYNEGITGRTVVNVPAGSTINIKNIFGGAYGTNALPPCDVYESNVNYSSGDATVTGAIYGGNNNVRRTIYGKVNINAPVWSKKDKSSLGTVYGAGHGSYTWSEYTQVNLNEGAKVYQVFGGGEEGQVLNAESVQQYMLAYKSPANEDALPQHIHDAHTAAEVEEMFAHWSELWKDAWTLAGYFEVKENADFEKYAANTRTNLANILTVRTAEMDERDYTGLTDEEKAAKQYRYNTNVIINKGATVVGYAYGGGLGFTKVESSGDVIGTTYVAVLGGTVEKDVYAGGRVGKVHNAYGGDFIASANAYVEGGTARNVYGGGYEGHVGKHDGGINTPFATDVLAETHVVIGKAGETTFTSGVPAITRNVYGGGEGGSVYGSSHVKVNNGYIGYRYKNTAAEGETAHYEYVPEVDDNGRSIEPAGSVFGGGYVVNSYVDETRLEMYGGTVRSSLYGGGEIGPVGRGTVRYKDTYTDGIVNNSARIFKAGKTKVTLYDGWVKKNVFGGGRGYDNWGGDGTLFMDKDYVATLDLKCKGFVFGQTEVNIHGGEIGTEEEMQDKSIELANKNGNVFGGGDVGFVYSAYQNEAGKLSMGKPSGKRYDEHEDGYYYEYEYSESNTTEDKYDFRKVGEKNEKVLTKDCMVLVEPWLKPVENIELSNGTDTKTFKPGDFIPTAYLNSLGNKNDNRWDKVSKQDVNKTGVIIHNAVFAGGNTSSGSTEVYASTTTVYGNATASINDVYHRDLITVGTGHTGGLYGEGNLTLVDGYRELNITNYGTDYYSISPEITYAQYLALPVREEAYYEIRYKCAIPCSDKNGKNYGKGSTISADELATAFEGVKVDKYNVEYESDGKTIKLDAEGYPISTIASPAEEVYMLLGDGTTPQPAYWIQNGVCSRYAGRIMNTIQRADFCGVFGSRMVMQGARDRVPSTVDYTNYTINRVREVSLNKKESIITADASDANKKQHGNYFGIYNIVNFLGALTSDVDFGPRPDGDKRVTDNENYETYAPDIDPAKVTITANSAAQTYLSEHPVTGITVSGSTVTAANAKALYDLRAQAISGITIAPNVTITATTTEAATAAGNIEDVTVNGLNITANSLEAYYKLRSMANITVASIEDPNQTYYEWKAIHHGERKRNNGNSHNKLALASGVYLELTTEKNEGKGDGLYDKDWGYITGVVELDLINVQTGMGGGFVYAKNIHGVRSDTELKQVTLADLNDDAVSRKHFTYTDPVSSENTQQEWQTSGNFVHSTQTIIDDCYNIGDRYKGKLYPEGTAMPAHYWYIKGSVYVYDQYISAYTGLPNAFSEKVNIPLTISSASHGKLTLLDVKPNLYAYYSGKDKKKLTTDQELVIRDVTYRLNDPIDYWEWYKLSADEKNLFVPKTYVTTDSCMMTVNGKDTFYPKGYVMLYDEYDSFYRNNTTDIIYEEGSAAVPSVQLATVDADGNPVVEKDYNNQPVYKPFDDVFHMSNNLSHKTGYILTYSVNNPMQWNTWYTPNSGSSLDGKINTETYGKSETVTTDYENGPTYTPTVSGVYGQTDYTVGNIISETVFNSLTTTQKTALVTAWNAETDPEKKAEKKQASFEPAYIVTANILEATNKNGSSQRFYKGAALAESDYTAEEWTRISGSVAPASVVTNTIQLNSTDYIYLNTYLTQKDINDYKRDYPSLTDAIIAANIKPAYYCTDAGKYGGKSFEENHNYRAIDAFSNMSDSDRENFEFNYDALDLLIDPTYSRAEGVKYQYDVAPTTDKNGDGKIDVLDLEENDVNNPAHYSLPTSIDYTATYKGSVKVTYIADDGSTTDTDTRDVLTNTEYEGLLNERYHYAPVKVTEVGNDHPYYVVNQTLILGDTPYAAGQVIDQNTYDGLNSTEKNYITTLKFGEGYANQTVYFCREPYTIAAEADGGKPVNNIMNGSPYSYGGTVPAGVVIDDTSFKALTNKQQGFVIHGMSPTETSTLYVVRNSDINDLSTEKIITVIYQYDYVESDVNGMSITPVSERHILNIHINFKSGVPTVEDILAPDIVLPGTTIGIKEPFVTPGAYEVTGGGWELFDDPNDAESHTNGIPYTPNTDPLYLYQDQYLVAYYAKTYLGKTYSNAVPVSVANFHDLKRVMGDQKHHYYIDHKDVFDRLKVEPKIYINDYTTDDPATSQNGLDLFKNLYDLSLVTSSSDGYTLTEDTITAVTGTANTALVNHALLDKTRVGAGKNLEFFLRTDIDHSKKTIPNESYDSNDPESPKTLTVDDPWTSIAVYDCFAGTLHGDGHHLSGLSSSLFDHLCGDVYNLGVSGTFTGAGIAESGSGYVENCWVSTSSTADRTSNPVFGTPARTAEEKAAHGSVQIVNCYYEEDDNAAKKYTNHAANSEYGVPTRKTSQEFYNGEVAYDLNGFYLYKRYRDMQTTTDGEAYSYWKAGETTPQTGYYGSDAATLCSSGSGGMKYVEDRFADGDFIYVGDGLGTIPSTEDERLYTYTGSDGKLKRTWYPIWPNDYLFFGQSLNYGHVEDLTHQDKPSSINRDNDGHILTEEDGNRVYRAPAYFRNNTMDVAHFNPYAVFAQTKKGDASLLAYKNMTAIDFTGSNGDVAGGYQKGLQGTKFYPPLLDDDGLYRFRNADLTKNLLVYTADTGANETAGEKTATVVSDYLLEPAYTESTDGYRTIAPQSVLTIKGHWVKDGVATRDHLLVDKEDFDAPIAYTFDKGRRMWYQREPADDEFVDRTKGWQAISLPFTAELVTTNQKGEITHFYSGSEESKNNTRSKIGHEYWLRELNEDSELKQLTGENNVVVPGVLTAGFTYPTSQFSDDEKTVTNTFLWDYYYRGLTGGHNQKDYNKDTYQEYYSESRTYGNYPLLAAGTPYLLGLPGVTYYEFDLSGTFESGTTTDTKPEELKTIGKQTITFVSEPGTTIEVSENQKTGVKKSATVSSGGTTVTADYYFKPNYLNWDFAAGSDVYTLVSQYDSTDDNVDNPDCSSFVKVPATGAVTQLKAFRPYFISSVSTNTRTIVFGNGESEEKGVVEHGDPKEEELNGGLNIWAKKDKIYVQSSLSFTEDLRVVTPAGITVATFTVKPGQTVEVQADFSGMYLVHTLDGLYTKKLTVRR